MALQGRECLNLGSLQHFQNGLNQKPYVSYALLRWTFSDIAAAVVREEVHRRALVVPCGLTT